MATLHDTALATNDASGTTLATADALAVTANDLIVVAIKWEGASTTIASATTGSGGSGSALSVCAGPQESTASGSSGDLGAALLWGVAPSTGTTNPEVVLAGSRTFRVLKALSFTLGGGFTQWALGPTTVGATNQNTSSLVAGATTLTATGVGVLFGALYGTRSLDATANGYVITNESGMANANSGPVNHRLNTSTGSVTNTGAIGGGSVQWLALAAHFYESTGGGSSRGRLIGSKLIRSNLLTGLVR